MGIWILIVLLDCVLVCLIVVMKFIVNRKVYNILYMRFLYLYRWCVIVVMYVKYIYNDDECIIF